LDNVVLAEAGTHKETKMPKLKTKSGVKKRFKITATGKIKHGVAGKRHRLISHNAKYIRQNRGTEVLAEADVARVKAWAPYGLK
jgi:large subunit ribosomal protein L35